MILLSSLGFGTIVFEFVMLILLLALVYKFYQRESSKLGTLDDMMKTGSLTFFKFLGSITTGLEVINLTISAVYNEVMGPFSTSTRYLTIGYLEVFFTFMYIRFCYKAVEDNEVWLLSKPKLIQGLFKIWVAIKYSPLFFLAFSVTAGISILYLENTGSLVMESTGKELFPYIWEAVSIKTVKSPDLSFIEAISKEVLSSLPQLSAFGLIYFTPFITLTMVILLILLPTKSTIEMLKREGLYGDDKKKVDSESDKKSEEKKETTGRRSRSRERSSGTERSRTTSDKDTDKKEEEDQLNQVATSVDVKGTNVGQDSSTQITTIVSGQTISMKREVSDNANITIDGNSSYTVILEQDGVMNEVKVNGGSASTIVIRQGSG